ncbi:MAG: hypothetical protein HQL19_03050 [Candidatus Omnitrophica bacterium]|nr:hypothetical protein [Candidatus Omnitrophota bacterium]
MIREAGHKTLEGFYTHLADLFEDKAISKRTLMRALKGKVVARGQTLNQIALTLGVGTSSVREGTDAEVSPEDPSEGVFTYNDKAALHTFSHTLPFVPGKLVLKAGGRTSEEQDKADAKDSVKWFMVQIGRVTLVLKSALSEERKTFHKGEHFAFNARQMHSFLNDSKSTSVVLIVHYPVQNYNF